MFCEGKPSILSQGRKPLRQNEGLFAFSLSAVGQIDTRKGQN